MRSGNVRLGLVVFLVGFLFVFFLPLLPFTHVVTPACSPPGQGGMSWCTDMPFGGSYSGYQSIGHFLAGWGATYADWLGGYVPPAISYDLGGGYSTLTALSVTFSVMLPIAIACVWLLAPEIVKTSKILRMGFGVFGAALFALADLMLISMVQQASFPWLIGLTGAFFGASGVLMVMYSMHTWPLGMWEHKDQPTP